MNTFIEIYKIIQIFIQVKTGSLVKSYPSSLVNSHPTIPFKMKIIS